MLDFSARWCRICKTMDPIIDRLILEGYNIEKVDTDDSEDLVNQYNIKSIPTFLFTRDGTEIDRMSGLVPVNTIKEKFEQLKEE